MSTDFRRAVSSEAQRVGNRPPFAQITCLGCSSLVQFGLKPVRCKCNREWRVSPCFIEVREAEEEVPA